MNKFIITSFVTKNTPYEEIIHEYLEKSLNNFHQIPYAIEYTENFGDWNKNTSYKPQHILNQINEKEKMYDAVVFLDSDATIERYPKLFEEIPKEYDIALHRLDHDTWYQNGSHRKELLSGTIFLRCNSRVKSLCKEWNKACLSSNEWEQKILDDVLKKRNDIKIYELPLEYIYIETLPMGLKPLVKINNPVIVHHQISRQTKRWFRCQRYNMPYKNNVKI